MRILSGPLGLLLCLSLPLWSAHGAETTDCATQIATPKTDTDKKRASFDELVKYLRSKKADQLLTILDKPQPAFKLTFEKKRAFQRDIAVRARRGKLQLFIRTVESKSLAEFEKNVWSLTLALFELGVADSLGRPNRLPAGEKTKGAKRGPELWTELRMQRILKMKLEAYRVVLTFNAIQPNEVLPDTDVVDSLSSWSVMYKDPLSRIRPNKADLRVLTQGSSDELDQKLTERYRALVLNRYQWRQLNRRVRFGSAVALTTVAGTYIYKHETRDTIPSFSTFSPEYDRELMATPIPPATASTADAEKFFRTVTQRFLSEEHRPLWPASNAPADTALLHNLCHKIYDMSVRFGDRSQIIRSSTLNQCTY